MCEKVNFNQLKKFLPGCLLDKDLKTAGIELFKKSLLVSPREAEIERKKTFENELFQLRYPK